MNQEQAQERIDELRGFYAHLVTFVAVNAFLIMIDFVTYADSLEHWFFYPLFGWGIGLVIHGFMVFGAGSDWEERKMQELTGWSMTQTELERLADRTDNLIAILADVNWQKIDPELVDAREKLLNARETIVEMRDYGTAAASPAEKDDVIREIEKLEEFVTSPKFKFVDQI